jgi:metal-dependent amidase/aminoacylase/carboxypeptidase family protein
MLIAFTGKFSHASEPENGKNPAQALADVIHALPSFTDGKKHKGLVMSTIVHIKSGSPDFGINPGDGLLCLTNRAESDEELAALTDDIKNCANAAAKKYGLSVEFSYRDHFPANVNDAGAFAKIKKAAANLKLQMIEMPEPIRGSEDFGWFSTVTPAAMFALGAGEDRPGIHTPDFDFNDAILPTVVDMYWELLNM